MKILTEVKNWFLSLRLFKPTPEQIRTIKIRDLNDSCKLLSLKPQNPPYKIKVFSSYEIRRFKEIYQRVLLNRVIRSEPEDYQNDTHSVGWFTFHDTIIYWFFEYKDRVMDRAVDPLDENCLRVLNVKTIEEVYKEIEERKK